MILLAEHARRVEPTIKGNIEQVSAVWVPRATRVVLHARVEDHLGDELVSREPCGGGDRARGSHVIGEWLAEAVIRYMRAHVSVNIESVTVSEETEVETRGQVVDINGDSPIAFGFGR